MLKLETPYTSENAFECAVVFTCTMKISEYLQPALTLMLFNLCVEKSQIQVSGRLSIIGNCNSISETYPCVSIGISGSTSFRQGVGRKKPCPVAKLSVG